MSIDEPALIYLRDRFTVMQELDDDVWQKSDRFFRAAQVILGVDGERLSKRGIQEANLLAIELLEHFGEKAKP